MFIPETFSAYLPMRLGSDDPAIFNGSTVHVRMDMSDEAIDQFVERQIQNAFESMLTQFLANQSIPTYVGSLPIQVCAEL